MNAFGMNTSMFLEGESRCCTCKGRISASDKIEVLDTSCRQCASQLVQRSGQRTMLFRQQFRNHCDLLAHHIHGAADSSICPWNLNFQKPYGCVQEMHHRGISENTSLRLGGNNTGQVGGAEARHGIRWRNGAALRCL